MLCAHVPITDVYVTASPPPLHLASPCCPASSRCPTQPPSHPCYFCVRSLCLLAFASFSPFVSCGGDSPAAFSTFSAFSATSTSSSTSTPPLVAVAHIISPRSQGLVAARQGQSYLQEDERRGRHRLQDERRGWHDSERSGAPGFRS